jgi:hypothetical protein
MILAGLDLTTTTMSLSRLLDGNHLDQLLPQVMNSTPLIHS